MLNYLRMIKEIYSKGNYNKVRKLVLFTHFLIHFVFFILIECNNYVKLSRPHRLFTALIALFSMLFMQLAVASYVCPGHAMGSATPGLSGDSGAAAMADCAGMDKEQPALCHVHAEEPYAKQSLDKPQVPDVQPFVLTGLTLTLQQIDIDAFLQDQQAFPLYLTRATAPPIAIRNCCLRI
ncbi:hypothetical protein [Undibacterium sp. TS12]|uniref:hypothetical protein n=1 Tax=Undibacterium sp. TS12 TaxID=2908202 RepID=UPI001F4C684B|nr:hypothetical protein [Undibacterium sp. TS12]MCH8618713.1 hypothetical protein [Undibacterium sp. TS12]